MNTSLLAHTLYAPPELEHLKSDSLPQKKKKPKFERKSAVYGKLAKLKNGSSSYSSQFEKMIFLYSGNQLPESRYCTLHC